MLTQLKARWASRRATSQSLESTTPLSTDDNGGSPSVELVSRPQSRFSTKALVGSGVIAAGVAPALAYATDLATEKATLLAALTPYQTDAVGAIIALGGVSFVIIFVVGVIKVMRAVL